MPSESTNNKKLIVFCPGLPGQPENANIMEYFTKLGFTCFFIKYSGTWESEGEFLKRNPEEDVREVIAYLEKNKKVTEFYTEKQINLNFDEIILFGSSFGGSVAIVAGAKDGNINKIVALAPVVNYKSQGRETKFEEENLENLGKFLKRAYGPAYRLNLKNWEKLISGEVDLNPSDYVSKLKKKDVLLIQGANDKSVSPKRTKDFFGKIESNKNSIYKLLKESTHLSFTNLPGETRNFASKWILKD